MKIMKAELVQKLNKIKGTVPKKSTEGAVQGILVSDGYLIANNLEIAIKAKMERAKGESFIIPEQAFDLIANLPDDEIEISSVGKDMVTIKADRIENKYHTYALETFPVPAKKEFGSELAVKADKLQKSMKRVSYAVAQQSSKPVMNSVCVQAAYGKLNLIGTNGSVMAWDQMEHDGEFELLIPKNAVEKVKSLDLSGDIKIKYTKANAVFRTDEFEIYTRLIEGKYFKYQAMFSDLPLHTVIKRGDLLDAMTRIKMCMTENRPVIFEFGGNQLNVTLSGRTTYYRETVDLQEEMEDRLKIGFNAIYVLETMKAFDCENIGISLGGKQMPAIIKAEDSDFKAIILPTTIV